MNILSPQFLALFALVIIIVTLRARSRRKTVILPEKQLAINGQQLVAYLAKDTPLSCLLADGIKYGDDFHDKTPPELPHAKGCRCRLIRISQQSREIFSKEPVEGDRQPSDLGELERNAARYYKYRLIARHPDSDEALAKEYGDLVRNVAVDEPFKLRVREHLGAG